MKKNLRDAMTVPVVQKRFHEDSVAGIRQRIQVLPELRDLIPPLLPDERTQLEANIRRDGCRESLLVWQTTADAIGQPPQAEPVYVLVDGHNRYAICQEHALPFAFVLRDFPDLAAVREFMIDNQLGRRNLTAEQMSYLRGKKYLILKKSYGGNHQPPEASARRTSEALAEAFGVSARTIANDSAFAKGLDRLTPDLRGDVLRKKVRLPKEAIRALGEMAPPGSPVATADELAATVRDSRRVAGLTPRHGLPAPPAELRPHLEAVMALARQLDEPGSDLLSTLKSLTREAQKALELLEG